MGWLGLSIQVAQGYYVRTIQEQEDLLRQSNFVIIAEGAGKKPGKIYPGDLLTPELIKAVSSDPSLTKIVDFTDSRGYHTYLFVRSSVR